MPVKFLINPFAREQGGGRLWTVLSDACARLGYVAGKDYHLEWTRAEDTSEQARQAADAWDRVVAVGGDGTVRAVAEGLLKAGTGAALGVIPQGTGNDFARVMGLHQLWTRRRRFGVETVVERLATGPTTRVDVLAANDRLYFVSYCGIGWDALVCRSYTRLRRHPAFRMVIRGRLLNECAYALLALRFGMRRLPELRLRLHTPEAGWVSTVTPAGASAVLVSNVASYAGGVPLVPDALHHDGLFELTTVPRPHVFALLILSRYWPRLRRLCPLETRRVSGVRLSLPGTGALQADGDDATDAVAGETCLTVAVAGAISAVYAPS